MSRFICFLLLSCPFVVTGTISEQRQKQLDSLVTNLPRTVVRDLDSAHFYMDRVSKNNEESVFMFYGFLSIHFKYDEGRAGGNGHLEYTPYYTCRKRSGVCRDFAFLFKTLCERSGIPCVYANGRVKDSFLSMLKDFVLLRPKRMNHAWNIVKYDSTWHLMDATWTHIDRTDKYYSVDEKGRKEYIGKAKRPSRTFYDCSSEVFYTKRSGAHPSYYITAVVPTYKTARRKVLKKKNFSESYNYDVVLDSIASNPYYRFSKPFVDEQKEYCQRYANNGYEWHYALSYLELKRTKKNTLTIASCQAYMDELNRMSSYLKSTNSSGVWRVDLCKEAVKAYVVKLEKKAARLNALKR